jgi:hypothetical protein
MLNGSFIGGGHPKLEESFKKKDANKNKDQNTTKKKTKIHLYAKRPVHWWSWSIATDLGMSAPALSTF